MTIEVKSGNTLVEVLTMEEASTMAYDLSLADHKTGGSGEVLIITHHTAQLWAHTKDGPEMVLEDSTFELLMRQLTPRRIDL